MLFLMRLSLFHRHICHNHVREIWLCKCVCNKYPIEHLQEKNGNIIKFEHYEKGNLLYKTHNLLPETRDDMENGNKYDDNSSLPSLISEE